MRPHHFRPAHNFDPFRAPQRWLLRLGARFYYPIVFVAGLAVIGLVVRDALNGQERLRRVVDLSLIGGACVAVLFWRSEILWGRGQKSNWLVRFTRPDLAFLWAGAAEFFIALGIILLTYLAGPNSAAANHLWPLLLFPLLFLSERGDTLPFLFLTALTSLLLVLMRLTTLNTLSGVTTPSLWLIILATSNYYLARRQLLIEMRADLLRQISYQLSTTPDVEMSLEAIAQLIGERLRHPHVRLWRIAPDGAVLQLHAAWGTDRAAWQGIERPTQRGWPGEVMQARAPVRWDELAQREPPPFEWARAALGVPILVGGDAVGVLEVISPHPADFWELDDEHLALLADSIGVALARSQHVRQEAERLRDTLANAISTISDCASVQDMFDEIARLARESLGADLVVLYQLAPGTGYPLTPPLFHGDFFYADHLRHPVIPEDSVLFELLARWEPYYSRAAQTDPLLSRGSFLADPQELEMSLPYGTRNRFLVREGVRAVAFLPMGSRSERVGALFLHYRAARDFSPSTQLTLEAFASLAAEPINRERAHWRRYEAFGGVLFGVHGPLTLSADSIRRLASTAQDHLRSDPDQAEAALAQALKVTRKLEMAAMLTRLAKREDIDTTGLRDALRRASTKLLQFMDPQSRVFLDIPPAVDDLPIELLDSLYCLAMEAVANASYHGHAKRIEIVITLDDPRVTLTVDDNGSGFDTEAARHGPNGIFEAIALVQQQFAATGHVESAPDDGTHIEVMFPCLPGVIVSTEKPVLDADERG